MTIDVERLSKICNALHKIKTDKLASRNENTPKRQREAMSARIDGWQAERAFAIGSAILIAGPEMKTPTKKALLEAACKITGSTGYYDHHETDEWASDTIESAILREFLPCNADALKEKKQLERLHSIRSLNIAGFFPTPDDVIDQMFSYVPDNVSNMLDPSFGHGAILKRWHEQRGTDCYGYEVDGSLSDYVHGCDWSGIHPNGSVVVQQMDFLNYSCDAEKYDAIVMNPPYEHIKGQGKGANAHIAHAIKFLRPGGTLVAVVPSNYDGIGEKMLDLPSGTFSKSTDGLPTAGVETCIIVYEKE